MNLWPTSPKPASNSSASLQGMAAAGKTRLSLASWLRLPSPYK